MDGDTSLDPARNGRRSSPCGRGAGQHPRVTGGQPPSAGRNPLVPLQKHGGRPRRVVGQRPAAAPLALPTLALTEQRPPGPAHRIRRKASLMSRLLYRLGHFSGRHPWRVLAAWLVLGISIFMLNSTAGGEPDESFSIPGAESQRAADAIADRFPQETLYTSNVLFHSDEGLTDPAVKAAIEQTVDRAGRGPRGRRCQQPLRPARTDPQRGRQDRLRHGRLRRERDRCRGVRARREGRRARRRRRRPGRVRQRPRLRQG